MELRVFAPVTGNDAASVPDQTCETHHWKDSNARVFDKSARKNGTFSREDFTYNHACDIYTCPGGKMLTTTGTLVNDGATMLYRASKHDCASCALKARCCPKDLVRKVPRSIHEGARDMARE